MGNGQSRRKFLENATKSLGLVGISPALSNFIVQTLSSQVFAAGTTNTNGSDKIYIFFALPGGPPRWFFDLPLTPNGNTSKFTDAFSHSGVATYVGMAGAGDPQAIYKAWRDPVSGYWLPPVWGSNPDGGSFKNCLANAAFIRGVDFESNNHDLGRIRNQSPIIGGYSIAGLLAEKTYNAFPAASSGSITSAFKATKPMSPVGLNYTVNASTNPIASTMRYFSGKAPVENLAVSQALSEFDKYADKNNFIQKSLTESKERSDALVQQGVSTFTDKWQPTYDKYVMKVKEAMSLTNTSSFMDTKPITPPPMKNGNPDMRTRRADGTFMGDLPDYRNMVNDQTTVSSLAATFATVEILITMGLTQVVTADLGVITNLIFNNAGGKFTLSNDQHFIGTLVSTIATTFMYRAMINCTEELVLTLKEKGLFDKTIIQFGAEFNRTAKADGSGSDHGFKGCSVLLISGMLKKTVVLGNIKEDPTSTYKGHWGMAAPHPASGNSSYPLRLNDVCKTVCGMLGLKNVSNNGEYILKNNGSQWEAFTDSKGEAKNV